MNADRSLSPHERRLRAAVLTLLAAVTLAKIVAAARLDLFGDEAVYWQCAQRPELHHTVLPFMTASLVRLGTWTVGDTTLGVRLCFLLIGALFPFVIHRLALPLVGEARAWLAAGSSLIVPATAHLGLIAVPDVPLLFFAALAFLGLERATRSGKTGPWLLAAAAIALGMCSHYRFILVPAGALLYLVTTRNGRAHWSRPGPWILLGGLAVGFLPTLVHTLRSGFGAVDYYLGGRHGEAVQPQAIVSHIAEQGAIITPLLYVALMGVLVDLVRRAVGGDDRAQLLALLALPNLLVFLVASPFHDVEMLTMHWPAPGYLPLLLYLPGALSRLRRWSSTRLWAAVVGFVPASGALAMLVGIAFLATGGHAYPGMLRGFEGWSELSGKLRSKLTTIKEGPDQRKLIVAGNYKLGANLEFGLRGEADVLILDHPINHLHGRASAFDHWGIGEIELSERVGQEALVILQRDVVESLGVRTWMAHVRSRFERLEPLDELRLGKGQRKAFLVMRGIVAPAPWSLRRRSRSAASPNAAAPVAD
ncbi:MAG: glycosyltransferase family 39 protein [Acidobacteria bacterium]|nr:glycosyltransferase family 39 protein [Acidobacteriota bacterium]